MDLGFEYHQYSVQRFHSGDAWPTGQADRCMGKLQIQEGRVLPRSSSSFGFCLCTWSFEKEKMISTSSLLFSYSSLCSCSFVQKREWMSFSCLKISYLFTNAVKIAGTKFKYATTRLKQISTICKRQLNVTQIFIPYILLYCLRKIHKQYFSVML